MDDTNTTNKEMSTEHEVKENIPNKDEVEMKDAPQAPKTPSNTNGDVTNDDTKPDQKSVLETLSTKSTNNATATPSNNTAKSKAPSSTKTTPSSKVPSFLLNISNGKMTYLAMVHETIADIGDRTGSSVPAIQKVMKNKYEHLGKLKHKAFNTNVYNAIRAGLKEERFVKVKNSYKINTSWVNKQKAMHRAKEAKKKLAEKKRKKEIEKARLEREKKKKMEMKEKEIAKKKEKEMKEMEMKKEKEKEKQALAEKMKVMTEEEKAKQEEKVGF